MFRASLSTLSDHMSTDFTEFFFHVKHYQQTTPNHSIILEGSWTNFTGFYLVVTGFFRGLRTNHSQCDVVRHWKLSQSLKNNGFDLVWKASHQFYRVLPSFTGFLPKRIVAKLGNVSSRCPPKETPYPNTNKKKDRNRKKKPKNKKKKRPDPSMRICGQPRNDSLKKEEQKKKKKRKEKLGNSVVAVWRRGDDPPTEGPSSSAVSSLISRRRFHFQQSAIAQLRLIDFFSFLNGKKKQKKTRRASYFSLSQLFYRWPAAAIIDFYFSMESSAFHSFSVVPYVIYIIFHGFTSSSIRSKPLMGRWFFLENPTSAN